MTDLEDRLAVALFRYEASHAEHFPVMVTNANGVTEVTEHKLCMCALCEDARRVLVDYPTEVAVAQS